MLSLISKQKQIVDGTSSDYDLTVALLYGRNKQNPHIIEFKLEDGSTILVEIVLLYKYENPDIPGAFVWFFMGYSIESLGSQMAQGRLLSDEDRKVCGFYSIVNRSGQIEPGWNGFICPPIEIFEP